MANKKQPQKNGNGKLKSGYGRIGFTLPVDLIEEIKMRASENDREPSGQVKVDLVAYYEIQANQP